jgi:hypothetical protein
MKKKLFFASFFVLFFSFVGYSQKASTGESLITKTAIIKKYHDRRELGTVTKFDLVQLCNERIDVLTRTLPFVALATKPGLSLKDFGIPSSTEFSKALEDQGEANDNYLNTTKGFQQKILPFSDKEDLIKAVLFYESVLKSLNEFKDL